MQRPKGISSQNNRVSTLGPKRPGDTCSVQHPRQQKKTQEAGTGGGGVLTVCVPNNAVTECRQLCLGRNSRPPNADSSSSSGTSTHLLQRRRAALVPDVGAEYLLQGARVRHVFAVVQLHTLQERKPKKKRARQNVVAG